jgi:hypothetical protein
MPVEAMIATGLALEQSEEHFPERPSWRCWTCGYEWPCTNAKADLIAESIACRTSVLVYLAMCQADATADLLPEGLPADLYDRFVGGVRANRDRAGTASTEGSNSR